MSHRCLLVDDDAALRDGVAPYLTRFGFDVTAVDSGAAMRAAVAARAPDIVVLDLGLPDEDGLSLCRWFRAAFATPLVMLTAQSDPYSRVVGLELGADDFVPKPFEPRELVARLNAVLRRTVRPAPDGAPAPVPPPDRIGGWTFDRLRRLLVAEDGGAVPLSNAEYRLLGVLADHAGEVLSRERLVELTAAPGADVTDRSVDLMVFRLRRKFAQPPGEPPYIRTVRGSGYVLDAGRAR